MGVTLTLYWWVRKNQCFRSDKVTFLDAWKMSHLVSNVLNNASKQGVEYGLKLALYNSRGAKIIDTSTDSPNLAVLLPDKEKKWCPAYLRVTGSPLHRSNNSCHLSLTLALSVNLFGILLLLRSRMCLAGQLYGQLLFSLLYVCEATYVLSILLTFYYQQEFQELIHRGSAWHVLKNQLGFLRQRRDCGSKMESVPVWNTSFKAEDREDDTAFCVHEKRADADLKSYRELSIKSFDNGAAAGWVNVISGLVFAFAVTALPSNSADPASVAALVSASLALVTALLT